MGTPNHMLHTFSRRGTLKCALALGLCTAAPSIGEGAPAPLNDRLTGNLSPVHDPCIIHSGGTYYVYCTGNGIPMRRSKDLIQWELAGKIFDTPPSWIENTIAGAHGIWAPDISFHDGRYWLYYAVSTFGSNRSAIGLATNGTLDPASADYEWIDHGPVIQSSAGDDYNCIDPNHVVDAGGRRWLAFGSFWSGLKLVELEAQSGKPRPGATLHAIAARPAPDGGNYDRIEASFIIRRGGFYYLFAAYDSCCKGAQSTYYTAYGRARDITGPYVDKRGRRMTDGYGEVILIADQQEKDRWRGPGHCAILQTPAQDYIVYHAYDKLNKGAPNLRIAPLAWDAAGWASAIT